MKSAMLETGSEISCLMFLPAAACASGICSRSCHRPRDCATDVATTALAITSCSSAAPMAFSSRPMACCSDSLLDNSSSTYWACGVAKGWGSCGKCCATRSRQKRDINSKPVRLEPQWSCIRFSKRKACPGEGSAASAVMQAFGCGYSFITGAVLQLYPQPKACITALAALPSPGHALRLLNLMQDHCGSSLTGFELMSRFCLDLVAQHFPQLPQPFATPHAQYVLLELSSSESEQHAIGLLENAIGAALEQEVIADAVVATSVAQSRGLWQLREHIPLAQAAAGKNIKHDISLPVSGIADFIAATTPLLELAFPGCQLVCFGHVGDGNLHYNVAPPDGMSNDDFLANQDAVNRVVHDSVHNFGGSISAEHGIGVLKREELTRYKSAVELNMMRAIKAALDPLGIMNPGKIL